MSIDLTKVAKFTKTVAEDFKDTTTGLVDMVDASKAIAQNINDLDTFLGVLNPLTVPIELVMKKITAGTMDASLKVMENSLTLLSTPGVQDLLKVIIGVMNGALTGITAIVDGLTWAMNTITPHNIETMRAEMMLAVDTMIDGVIAVLLKIPDLIVDKTVAWTGDLVETVTDNVDAFVDEINEGVGTLVDTTHEIAQNVEQTGLGIGQKIHNWWSSLW